jgi:hypothetical protein
LKQSLAATALAVAASCVLANDRPFLATNSAAAEEDDDQVWSVETVAQRAGAVLSAGVAPEYAFNPTTSLQLELTHARDRAARENTQEAEWEFKHLFNHIARDGYGWGLVSSIVFAREPDAGWRYSQWSLKLPYSLQLWEGKGMLHLNAGAEKPRDDKRAWTASIALEREVARHTVAFGELARDGEGRLAHGGVRYWLRRERLALDVAMQRVRSEGVSQYGLVLGLGWYDLR